MSYKGIILAIIALTAFTLILGGGCEKTKYIVIGPEMEITTTSLSNPSFGKTYSAEVRVQGGIPQYTWAISSGSLPDGLTLNEDNGAITGRCHKAGTFDFTVQITDDNNVSVSSQFSLQVHTIHYDSEWTAGMNFDNTGNFKSLRYIAVDSSGNVYILDRDNAKVLKFDSSGNFLYEIKSSAQADFNSPRQILVDSSDSLYVLNYESVYVFSSNSAFIGSWYASEVNYVAEAAIDSYGFIYLLDGNEEGAVHKYDSQGSHLFEFGNSSIFEEPEFLTVDLENNIYVVDGDSGYRVQKFDSAGNLLYSWENSSYYCNGFAVDSSGNYFILNYHKVEKYDNNGSFVCSWGEYGTADGEFQYPIKIVAADNCFYIADSTLRMQKFDSAGTFVMKIETDLSAEGVFDQPFFVAVSPSGNLYVSDMQNHRIQVFDNAGNFVSCFGSEGVADDQFRYPTGIAFSSNSCFICDAENNRIKKYDLSNNFVKSWGGEGEGNGQFHNPYGIATDSNGNVYVADPGNRRVQIFNSNGDFISAFGNGSINAVSVAVDCSGNIFVSAERELLKYDNQGNFLSILGSQFYEDEDYLEQPFGVAFDSEGNMFVCDSEMSCIVKFDLQGNFICRICYEGTRKGAFENPAGIAVSSGVVYVVENGNQRVQALTPNAERGDAPELQVSEWIQGSPYSIANSSGITLLFFWSGEYLLSESVDTLHQLSSDFGDNLSIVAVGTYSMDYDYAVGRVSAHSMTFPVAIDDRESTVEAYNCDTPEAVLVDKYGSVIWKGRINSNPHYLLVKQQIDGLLSE